MVKIARASSFNAKEIVNLNVFVHEIHVAAYPQIFKPSDNGKETTRFFEKLLDDEKNYFYLATIDEQPAGYVWAQLNQKAEDPLMYKLSRIDIHHLCVDENYRRQGVASSLMNEVLTLAKDKGIRNIALDTGSFNKDAQAFFEHQGFDAFTIRLWKVLH